MKKDQFTPEQFEVVYNAVEVAEELVSSYYKMSPSQWLRHRFEVRTETELTAGEMVEGPFAQIVKYSGAPGDSSLGSVSFDLFRICLQDSAILNFVGERGDYILYPFLLYIVTHELVHIVRFGQFEQFFHVGEREKIREESIVHGITRTILGKKRILGLEEIIAYYNDAE